MYKIRTFIYSSATNTQHVFITDQYYVEAQQHTAFKRLEYNEICVAIQKFCFSDF